MALRRGRAAGTGALIAVALCAAPSIAGAATGSVVSGTVARGSVGVPGAARAGQAQVLAMNSDSLAFADAAVVDRRGRYRLELPAGRWALRSSVVTPGRPFASFLSAAIATRAGQRRSLPLTLKRFKKARKRRGSSKRPQRSPTAHAANVNPRDGRSYPGEAFGFERFTLVGGDAVAGLGSGVPDMLITDLLTKPRCPFTIVEWMKRGAVLDELKLQQSEYVDPASRVEPGHVIDPEILIRGRVEDRPGTPHRIALIAWLVDARTGARLSGNVSAVTLQEGFFAGEERLALLVQRDLICARTKPRPPAPVPPPAAAPAAQPASPPVPPPSPPVPPSAADVYRGTFSGEAYSDVAGIRWTWNGTVVMDAADDQSLFPPNGAPPGPYRVFTVSSGSAEISLRAVDPTRDCVYTGTRQLDVPVGLINTLTVQLDVPNPAYALQISGDISKYIDTVKTGSQCPSGPTAVGIFGIWASTGLTAHTSPGFSIVDSQSELTPQTAVDYEYTTRWNLAPALIG